MNHFGQLGSGLPSPAQEINGVVSCRHPLDTLHACAHTPPCTPRHTTADGLLEGPTADSCEKGGRYMPYNPRFTYRKEVQDYLRSCEHLLVAATSPLPFTEDEVAMIGAYVAEVQKIFAVSMAK